MASGDWRAFSLSLNVIMFWCDCRYNIVLPGPGMTYASSNWTYKQIDDSIVSWWRHQMETFSA